MNSTTKPTIAFTLSNRLQQLRTCGLLAFVSLHLVRHLYKLLPQQQQHSKIFSITVVHNTAMFQPPGSLVDPDEGQIAEEAIAVYCQLIAAGHIKPLTNITLPPAPYMNMFSLPSPPLGRASHALEQTETEHTTSENSLHTSAHIQQPEPLATDGITRATMVVRIQALLQDKLTMWEPVHIATLSTHLANEVMSLTRKGQLGPRGISSVNDIFMAVGHEGPQHYMALAVYAPTALKILLRGQSNPKDGTDPLADAAEMENLRQGFHDNAMVEWQSVDDGIRRKARR
jgi:hypothetical protein